MSGIPEANFVGYIADYAAIAGMQHAYHTRYAFHSGLKTKSMSYFRDKYNIHGDIDRWYVCVFEVKVSRSDFLNTFGGKQTPHAKARMEPVGTVHWVVADKEVCKPSELPEFWGLLTPYGSGLTEAKIPKINVLPDSSMHAMAFDLLWLHHNTRWSTYKELEKLALAIRETHTAIRNNVPREELRQISRAAVMKCRRLV